MITRQSSYPCPQCGCYYRNIDTCTQCGKVIPEKEGFIFTGRHANQGRQWSKKYHRYLTSKEIKNGMKGG